MRSLTRPRSEDLKGPAPTDGDGDPIKPYDRYGHDVLWALDRMVRSPAPALERMALIWHDWFATADVQSQKLSIKQWKLFRKHALGNFHELVRAVNDRPRDAHLALGHRQPQGLAERELRARAHGAVHAWRGRRRLPVLGGRRPRAGAGPHRLDGLLARRHRLRRTSASRTAATTSTTRRSSARPATSTGRTHAACASSTRRTRPTSSPACGTTSSRCRPTATTQAALEELYLAQGYDIRPVVEAILMHPTFHTGPAMVKPPMVLIAGMLRARKRGVKKDSWSWISDLAGQRVFRPPNVSGWDETRWLDTSSFRGRWIAGALRLRRRAGRAPTASTARTRPRPRQ